MNDEKQRILFESMQLARSCFEKMCKKLNMNMDCFEYLFDNDITKTMICNLNYDPDHGSIAALYYSHDNIIVFDSSYIEELVEYLKEHPNDSYAKQKVLNAIAATALHEIIHANRNIIIEGAINKVTNKSTFTNLLKKHSLKTEGYDVDEYERTLEKLINKESDFEKFIPIKVIVDENKKTSIIVYNKKTGSYQEFLDCSFVGLDDTLYDIGIKLNQLELNPIDIYQAIDSSKLPQYQLAGFCYSPNTSIVNENEVDTNAEYVMRILDSHQKVSNELKTSVGLEESITEALADIMVMTKNHDKLDFNKIVEKTSDRDIDNYCKSAVNLISALGEDFIRWFLLSAHEDVYDNKLENIFQDDYNNLLYEFNKLYDLGEYSVDCQETVDSINSIIEKKKIKQKVTNNK